MECDGYIEDGVCYRNDGLITTDEKITGYYEPDDTISLVWAIAVVGVCFFFGAMAFVFWGIKQYLGL